MAKRFAGFSLFSGLVAIIAACGGSALTEVFTAQAGAAGASSGGAGPSFGGATSAAGSSLAGAPAIAGSSSVGGAPGDPCAAPKVSGPCDGYQPSFWHNPKTGLCEPFTYGGCDGNDNRYDSRDACLKACPGGGSEWGACKVDSDCTLTGVGCCEACDPVGDKDLLALSAAHLAEQVASRPCANVGACAPCPSVSVLVESRKYFRAVCASGQCSALDARQSAYTECGGNGGCSLRNGVSCCLDCRGAYVAVNSNADFCPDGAEPCGKCLPVPPPDGLFATCEDQRCTLQESLK